SFGRGSSPVLLRKRRSGIQAGRLRVGWVAKVLLEVKNLSVRYGTSVVVEKANLTAREGQVVALLGANGAGKSSFLKAIMGFVESSGEVVFDGERISGLKPWTVARKGISFVQEGRGILRSLTVEDNLLAGLFKASGTVSQERALELTYE